MKVLQMDERRNTDVGVIRELGDLPAEAVVSEEGLAKILGKHRVSVKRAVHRGELPVPVRMFGESVWTVQALREHIAKRLEAARKEAEQLQRRISQVSA